MRLKSVFSIFLAGILCQQLLLCQVCLAETVPSNQDPIYEATQTDTELAFFEPTNAYGGNNKFYIRFTSGGNTFYGSGPLPELEEEESDYGPSSFIVRLDNIQMEKWDDLPDDARSVTVLPREIWESAMLVFFRELIPEGGKKGIVVEFFDQREYFYYFDANVKLEIDLLEEKPHGIGVHEVYTHDEFIEMVLNHLRKVLIARGFDDPPPHSGRRK